MAFRDQNEVSEAVLDVSNLLEVPRFQLGMRASSKGFLAGNVKFQDHEGQLFDCVDNAISISDQWISCPEEISIQSSARFILVVEKERVFNRLLSDGFSEHLPRILITGKGISDLATRKCLRKLVGI